MLLGLKSTLEEVELNVMAQRLHAAKWAAAQRGELRSPLPVGFVHDDAGEVVIDPDAEVLAAIGDPFAAFAAFGPTYRVVAALAGWLNRPGFDARLRRGLGRAAALGRPDARVLGVLKNVEPDGMVHTGQIGRPRVEWPVLIPDRPRQLHRLGRTPISE